MSTTDIRESPSGLICPKTGLALVASRAQLVTRLCDSKIGPLNPLLRNDISTVDRWNRWDVYQARTIYASSTAEAAYGETLAQFRPGLAGDISDYLDPLGSIELEKDPRVSLLDMVTVDWEDHQLLGPDGQLTEDRISYMRPKRLSASWRHEHSRCELYLPLGGWFVDIDASSTVAAVRHAMGPQLRKAHELSDVTLSEIASSDRALTAEIASWLRSQTLFDGSLLHGVRFMSKYGADWEQWAIWLRAMDDEKPVASEPTEVKGCREVLETDPDLLKVANLYGLRIF